jgi:glycosyltransferase involved in cell wall biosynthesis
LSQFYRWGGTTTFTAHLLNSLRKETILLVESPYQQDKKKGNFGYGLQYQTVPTGFLDRIDNPFIVDFFRYNHVLSKLKRDDITIVIHDPAEISKENQSYLKYWNIICIRKAMQQYLRERYDVNSKFLYHPFYPYPIDTNNNCDNLGKDSDCGPYEDSRHEKKDVVSISRVDYGKNTEIIMEANALLQKEQGGTDKNCNSGSTIKIHGPFDLQYVNTMLGGKENFIQYYYGTFKKSFGAISRILNKAKFVVDLSLIRHDGGGTQYTFLEAIYHNAALIINRNWIEKVDKKHRDFEEGYNCFAASNGNELAEIIKNSKNTDIEKVVRNSKKLLHRHINANWSSV